MFQMSARICHSPLIIYQNILASNRAAGPFSLYASLPSPAIYSSGTGCSIGLRLLSRLFFQMMCRISSMPKK